MKSSGKQLFSERLKCIFLLKYIFIFFTFGSFYNFLQLFTSFYDCYSFCYYSEKNIIGNKVYVFKLPCEEKFVSNSFEIHFKFLSNANSLIS